MNNYDRDRISTIHGATRSIAFPFEPRRANDNKVGACKQ